MKKVMVLLVVLCLPFCAAAQGVGGLWQGKWLSPDGFMFEFYLHLDHFPDGKVKGYFIWKFKEAPEGHWYYSGKTDQEAIEYVKGNFSEHQLRISGHDKDDPHWIISLDDYEMELSEDGNTLKGRTNNNGTWRGYIEAKRTGLP